MIQSRLALKPDGLFLAAIFGGETLKELRIACTIAHMEREGGVSPRISPLAQVRDAGNLLTRASFTLPGVDVDEYQVRYNSALELIEHLRAMGETNALVNRVKFLKRDTALATAAVYESMFAAEDGTVPATFQVIYMTGWRENDGVLLLYLSVTFRRNLGVKLHERRYCTFSLLCIIKGFFRRWKQKR